MIMKHIDTEASTARVQTAHMTEREVAELLNMSHRTLQGWRSGGGGPRFGKFGRSVRYDRAAVEAWIADQERSSTSATCPPSTWGKQGKGRSSELKGRAGA